MDNNRPIQDDEEPIISLIQQIKDGTLNPKAISQDVRKRCVTFFLSEGWTEEQIGQILMRNERTIRRDLEKIYEQNSLSPDADSAKKIIGSMFQKALVHHRYLMRLARNPDSSSSDKSQSEFLAWRVLKELIEKMQTLGYLPMRPKEVMGDVYHHCEEGDTKTHTQLKEELKNIEKIARESGTLDKEIEKNIKLLEERIEKSEIAEKIIELEKNNKNQTLKEGSENDSE